MSISFNANGSFSPLANSQSINILGKRKREEAVSSAAGDSLYPPAKWTCLENRGTVLSMRLAARGEELPCQGRTDSVAKGILCSCVKHTDLAVEETHNRSSSQLAKDLLEEANNALYSEGNMEHAISSAESGLTYKFKDQLLRAELKHVLASALVRRDLNNDTLNQAIKHAKSALNFKFHRDPLRAQLYSICIFALVRRDDPRKHDLNLAVKYAKKALALADMHPVIRENLTTNLKVAEKKLQDQGQLPSDRVLRSR